MIVGDEQVDYVDIIRTIKFALMKIEPMRQPSLVKNGLVNGGIIIAMLMNWLVVKQLLMN